MNRATTSALQNSRQPLDASNYFKSKVAMEKDALEQYSKQVNCKQSFHFFFLCTIYTTQKVSNSFA